MHAIHGQHPSKIYQSSITSKPCISTLWILMLLHKSWIVSATSSIQVPQVQTVLCTTYYLWGNQDLLDLAHLASSQNTARSSTTYSGKTGKLPPGGPAWHQMETLPPWSLEGGRLELSFDVPISSTSLPHTLKANCSFTSSFLCCLLSIFPTTQSETWKLNLRRQQGGHVYFLDPVHGLVVYIIHEEEKERRHK